MDLYLEQKLTDLLAHHKMFRNTAKKQNSSGNYIFVQSNKNKNSTKYYKTYSHGNTCELLIDSKVII